jgi:hypothetical protein
MDRYVIQLDVMRAAAPSKGYLATAGVAAARAVRAAIEATARAEGEVRHA